jgi:hypothetical protein
MSADARERERRLLKEAGALADRARELRRTDAMRHHAEIKLVTGDLQAKWREIRELRATPAADLNLSARRNSRE